jgi:hypothetical protein
MDVAELRVAVPELKVIRKLGDTVEMYESVFMTYPPKSV